jgi:hypothetical protein
VSGRTAVPSVDLPAALCYNIAHHEDSAPVPQCCHSSGCSAGDGDRRWPAIRHSTPMARDPNLWNHPELGLGNYMKDPILIQKGYSNLVRMRLEES